MTAIGCDGANNGSLLHVANARALGYPQDVAIDYATPLYTIRQAAFAADLSLHTLRSYYGRKDFRIVGGEDKRGAGVAALLTLPDVLCITVAARLIEMGFRPKPAFEMGVAFAYFPSKGREAAKLIETSRFTVLLCWAKWNQVRIIGTDGPIDFSDLFALSAVGHGHVPAVAVLLNDIERRVFWALHLSGPQYDDPNDLSVAESDAFLFPPADDQEGADG